AVSSICGVSYSAAGDQGENGITRCGYGRAAGQEALGGVVVASAVQEHLHQDRMPAERHCPIECAVKRRRKISIARPKELPGPPAEARMTNAGSTPPELSMAAFSEKHTLLRASVILTCIGFVCYLQFPVLGCSDPPSLLTSSSAMRQSGKAHQAFGIITLLLFYALVVILVLYVFVEEASNYNILAFVCFVIAFVTAAFILLAAFVEPTLINQSAPAGRAWGATCSALSGILLLVYCIRAPAGPDARASPCHRHSQQATGTQHTQKLLTSNERGDEEGNQHGQLLGFIHKRRRHHDDGGNIEQVGQHRHGLAARAAPEEAGVQQQAEADHAEEEGQLQPLGSAKPSWRPTGASGKTVGLSRRLLAKADRLSSLRRARPASVASLHRNNNKCCNGVGGRNGNMMADAALMEALVDSHNTSADDFNREGSIDPTCCLCPALLEHACPGCGYSSRVVMTMRAVDGLKEIANAQKARFRNGRMATIGRCRPAASVAQQVVLSKFTRGDGSAFLSPWRPYYAGPLRKGRPRESATWTP
uniref:MARVEL domain-containing protein n=1 Tax=Macrostomum lignano TaxID=282301 RepID=A0A1I8FF39_9PLAT